jgi:hypothetical protein
MTTLALRYKLQQQVFFYSLFLMVWAFQRKNTCNPREQIYVKFCSEAHGDSSGSWFQVVTKQFKSSVSTEEKFKMVRVKYSRVVTVYGQGVGMSLGSAFSAARPTKQ